MNDKLYLTRQQIKEIINNQPHESMKEDCINYFKDKDLDHIEAGEVIYKAIFDVPQDIIDLYDEYEIALLKKERENNKSDYPFSRPPMHIYTEEEKKEIRAIANMTDEEIEEDIKDLKWSDITMEELSKRRGMF